ncbi:LytR/AlgR family response regulator transcription factor [Aquimarina aggregata]|uniref:LytR/AlgR family response regulator transcription factor n=1 Tax=Aquimarina aggregata TaxID=1642818 RepID=UPI0024925473|nr:LytTR family DNA-binding domain-containing protein [Aquimarina aggregata]
MIEKIKCIIVDDEPPAIRLLEKHIAKVSFLELITTTTNSLAVLEILEKQNVDLLFLDIQMPNLTGIQLSKIIDSKIKVIFTTAYPQFALESYDLNAIDYVLKPFDFERFYKAVSKLKPYTEVKHTESSATNYVFIKTDGKNNLEKVYVDDILYIEGLKNYVAIHLTNKQIITYNTLKHIYETLPNHKFIQIHKSYVVSIAHIDKTSSTTVQIHGNELPLGNTYKTDFFKKIDMNIL